jgi:pimeloyl-ACP methyl ester carboxylesterase
MVRVGSIVLIAVAVAGAGLYAAAPPVTLKTTELGRGPALVFLHALGSERMVWMPTARKLMATHRVILVDLPGHKDSPLPDPFSIEACTEAFDQVLAKQKPESTVIVAHGFGGLIALHEVKTHPDRARGLIVIDAAAKSTFKIPDQQQSYFLQMLDSNYDEILKRMFAGQGRDSLQNLEMYAIAQQVPPATMKAYLKTALNVDETAALKTMKRTSCSSRVPRSGRHHRLGHALQADRLRRGGAPDRDAPDRQQRGDDHEGPARHAGGGDRRLLGPGDRGEEEVAQRGARPAVSGRPAGKPKWKSMRVFIRSCMVASLPR